MKVEDVIPTASSKKEIIDPIFGRKTYKFWALAAILLLAFWSMFTGSVTLKWSAGNFDNLSDILDVPIHDDLDVLEIEEREKVVRHMWDVYANSRRIQLTRFWQEAFEAAYEEMASDEPEIRDSAVTEIAKMSMRILDLDPPSADLKYNGEKRAKKEDKRSPRLRSGSH
ncbi:hypothetical protein ZOSMA_261G00140 [Zostera marina]|uniref:Uncharacterized protein n=1 Tax=Zostera marina TaxID=29655 RepID=A0A0K9PEY0_ZOSMR|nr:hypothetical protein ZOSMA_261G00140 [Zostera marina]